LLPTLVEPEDLANAISMNSIQFNPARIIGPTLGGLAYTHFGATWCFALNGISYIAVIISLIVIKVQFVAPKTQTSVLNSMFVSVEDYFVICLTCAQEVEGD
jgi:predicted MFS family arabinose efflux permease